jgi:hypothetical protein
MNNAYRGPQATELKRLEAECDLREMEYVDATRQYDRTGLEVDQARVVLCANLLLVARHNRDELDKRLRLTQQVTQHETDGYPQEEASSSTMYGLSGTFLSINTLGRFTMRVYIILITAAAVLGLGSALGW